MARDYGYNTHYGNAMAGWRADTTMKSYLESKGRDTKDFKDFYNQYTDYDLQPGSKKYNFDRHLTVDAFTGRRKSQREEAGKIVLKDYDAYLKHKDSQKAPVAESTVQAQSTQQANLRAQQTGTPDANNQVSESQKDTETKRRQNKSRGKRGFVVSRESGQGINI